MSFESVSSGSGVGEFCQSIKDGQLIWKRVYFHRLVVICIVQEHAINMREKMHYIVFE